MAEPATRLSPAEQAVKKSFHEAMKRADDKRRSQALVALNYFYNDYEEDFAAFLSKVFEHPEEKIVVATNPLAHFATTRAQVFTDQPSYTVTVNGEESERDTELWNHLVDKGRWNDIFAEANALEFVVGTVGLKPAASEDGHLALHLITPDFLKVQQREDDPSEAFAVMYEIFRLIDSPFAARKEEWAVWTPDQHFVVDESGKPIRRMSDGMENPYGLIPIAFTRSQEPRHGEFFSPIARDQLSIMRAVNVGLIAIEHAIVNGGFNQAFSVNFPEETLRQKGMDVVWMVDGIKEGDVTPNVGILDFAADFEGLRDGLEYIMQLGAMMRGVPASEFRVTGSQPESGRARWIDRMPLQERRRDDISRWRRTLARFFEIAARVWSAELAGDGSVGDFAADPEFNYEFSEGAELQVDFVDPKFPEDEIEKRDRWEQDLKLGVISRVDIIMEQNPDLSREEAEKRLKEIGLEQGEFRGANVLGQINMRPDDDEELTQ